MQFGFILGCGTTDLIFIIRQLQEKHLIANKPLYMAFVYLEKKAFLKLCTCTSRFYLVGNAHAWNRRVVSAPGLVHVQGCMKPGKSRRWILPVIWCLSWFSSGLCP